MELNTCADTLAEVARHLGARGTCCQVKRFIAGVLWILRTGAPWRDLPSTFGQWNSVFRQFRRWIASGRWQQMFDDVRRPADCADEIILLDSTIIKAHPDAAGARSRSPDSEALGRSRGGFTTKVHALVSVGGRWVAGCLSPGQRADITQAIPLLDGCGERPRQLVADRAYDSNRLLAWLHEHSITAVIPSRSRRRKPRLLDWVRYADRNVIERFFGRLKRLRRVGTRNPAQRRCATIPVGLRLRLQALGYDKTAASFGAFVELGALLTERTAWA